MKINYYIRICTLALLLLPTISEVTGIKMTLNFPHETFQQLATVKDKSGDDPGMTFVEKPFRNSLSHVVTDFEKITDNITSEF